MSNVAEIFQVESPADLSMGQLLQLMTDKVNAEALEYNELIDQIENLDLELKGLSAINAKLTAELTEEIARSASLKEGNSQLMSRLSEVSESDRKARVSFDVATEALKRKALQVKELEEGLKKLKALGDPKRLVDNNRELRERNKSLMVLNESLKARNIEYEKSYKQLLDKSAFNQLPSFTSSTNEQLFIHPNLVSCETPEGPRNHVALTYWSSLGIGRLVTWNGDVPRFASFKHKTVDERFAPSTEAVEWATTWFKDNVAYSGEHQVLRTKFMVKERR